jgi:hypothetical protein
MVSNVSANLLSPLHGRSEPSWDILWSGYGNTKVSSVARGKMGDHDVGTFKEGPVKGRCEVRLL